MADEQILTIPEILYLPRDVAQFGATEHHIKDLLHTVYGLHSVLRDHVIDWGDCDNVDCDCSHRRALNLLEAMNRPPDEPT